MLEDQLLDVRPKAHFDELSERQMGNLLILDKNGVDNTDDDRADGGVLDLQDV